MNKITIDPVTRIEGHAKITLQLDESGEVDRCASARAADPRVREVHRGPAVLRNARDHGPDLRHLSGEPFAGCVKGVRRHHGSAHFTGCRGSCGSCCTARNSCSRTR